MNKYLVFPYKGEVYCKLTDAKQKEKYLSLDEFVALTQRFMHASYTLTVSGENYILNNSKEELTFNKFDVIKDDSLIRELAKKIEGKLESILPSQKKDKYYVYSKNGKIFSDHELQSGLVKSLSVSEYKNLLNEFIRGTYSVRIKKDDYILNGQDKVLILRDFDEIKDYDKDLEDLHTAVQEMIKISGYFDVTQKSSINPRLNRDKSNEITDFIKTVAAVLAITGTLFIYGKSKKKNNIEIPHESLEIEETTGIENEQITEQITEQIKDSVTYVEEVNKLFPIEIDMLEKVEENSPVGEAPQPNENGSTENPEDVEIESNKQEEEPIVNHEDLPLGNGTWGYLDFDDYSDSDKSKKCKENYYDIFLEAERKFGVDADLLLAMAIQERGVHSEEVDRGGAIGIMQIQKRWWADKNVTYHVYNEETGEFEKTTTFFSEDMLKDLRGNIYLGAIILQRCIVSQDYNIPLGMQSYNQGCASVTAEVNAYCEMTGKDYHDVVKNPSDLGWVEYTYLYPGDANYLKNVNRWVKDHTYTIQNFSTGELVTYSFTNDPEYGTTEKSLS